MLVADDTWPRTWPRTAGARTQLLQLFVEGRSDGHRCDEGQAASAWDIEDRGTADLAKRMEVVELRAELGGLDSHGESGRPGFGARPGWRWDAALSFAGAQRDYVEQAIHIQAARRPET